MIAQLRVLDSSFLRLFAATTLVFVCTYSTHGQTDPCQDSTGQTSGLHKFRHPGESIAIPLQVADCRPVMLELRWINGRNNGSNFYVRFLDANNQPIYAKTITGFLTGAFQFPLTSTQDWNGSRSIISVPSIVTIEATPPFAYPSTISYTVTLAPLKPRPKVTEMGDSTALDLRTAPGRLVSESRNEVPSKSSKSTGYRLEEILLGRGRELELNGVRIAVERTYRLTLSGGDYPDAGLIWIDDAALPTFRTSDTDEVGALIFDASILRDGAEISVSNSDGSNLSLSPARLALPDRLRAVKQSPVDEGNMIVSIHSAVRVVGIHRLPLVQIELRTNRPFPVGAAPLQLLVGKRFFINELAGDHTGRRLIVSLTAEMFAGLKEGAEIIAFLNKPDRSGASGKDVWYFGRLNKSLLDR